ncbi:isoleucine--tRNA ligase [Reichenbachiella carrageenanivorans]|uniref:Isoleucine--tRNA ligase n=1 Tax=Reichenbachiella carrageenanivorans TaxID=2979869 RepID=A0ABY6D4A2_9BACT|nr:isoleucine--tRNA ligase [Reichenbachiella carrageenanivorans]UXX80739.1 isoleucine--tRNA ligase [Reichenbachiella carrageenanivorans]
MSYKEYKNINYAEVANEVLEFWKKNDVFQKSVDEREGAETFVFYEGPPSANGTPGIHHVMARAVKDIFCRYKTLKGYQVKRKGGWDTHGLPVELQVEKELGITKEDIGTKISVEAYNAKCREAVMKFKNEWDDLTEKMGYWVDLDDPYITFEKDYIESLWHLLKKFYDKDLLYKGYTVQPFSPAAGTGLSSHELNQPGTYRDVKDTSVVAQFKVKKTDLSAKFFSGEEELFFLAWTTTPWTLPSNGALVVGKKIKYVKVKTFNPYTFQPISVILAKDLVGKYFSEKAKEIAFDDYKGGDKLIPWQVEAEYVGTDLLDVRYEQLFPYVTNEDLEANAFRVIAGDFVTTADGTGIVHAAALFGADDYFVSKAAGVPPVVAKDDKGDDVPLVDKQGRFVADVTDFAGMHVKEEYYSDEARAAADFKPTDVLIAIHLKEANRAFKVEKYEHSYPHCWRTDKPVLYYPLDSWFIKTTAYKDRLVELNNTINWKPASTGSGRFGNWLENLVDWNLSRSRYWGTPLPIWVTEDRTEQKCIGSIAELEAEVKKSIAAGFMTDELGEDFDLHRPYVDDIFLVSDSGQRMTREPDLIDVWFDSGAMPYAQFHFMGDDPKDATQAEGGLSNVYPADFIAEGVDQTRGWFFTLHAIAVMLFDKVSFKNVIANGLVLDKNGNKMSKRLGNAVNPFETLAKYGPDATRWYMIANANPWDNLKFDIEGVAEVQRRFFGTLYNTYSFFALYANLDKFNFSESEVSDSHRTESDRWIISKLNTLIAQVDEAYHAYEPTRAARMIQDFVIDDMSNWYVRLNRKRFWKGEYNEDKKAAYQALYTCLKTIAKLASPIAPFYMDRLYSDLNAVSGHESHESVHLSNYPVANADLINKDLEISMAMAQKISSLVHSLRKKEKLKVRQPLSRVMVPVLNKETEAHIKAVEELILNEVNVKAVEFIDDTSDILVKSIKPNFRKLGKEYGSRMKDISQKIATFTKENIATLEAQNAFEVDLGDQKITLTLEDVEISSQDIPGWLVASENGLTVALDIQLSDELRQEGVARDLVNRIQNLRKDSGLEVQDKIVVQLQSADELVQASVGAFKDYICQETQANELNIVSDLEGGQALEMDDIKVSVKLDVVNN